MSINQGSVNLSSPSVSGAPFTPTSAANGLSIDPVTGKVVLGNDAAAILATLLSNREIPMSTFQMALTWAAAQSLTFGALAAATLINAVITNAATLQGINVQHNVVGTFTGYRAKNFNSAGTTEFDLANNINNGLFITIAGSTAAGPNILIYLAAAAETRFTASGAANFFRWFTGAGAGTQRMAILANGRVRVAANNTDAGSQFQVDGSMTGDKFISARNLTPITINQAQERGYVFTNEGASALIVFNLPVPVAGNSYTFIVQDVDGIQVKASAAATIRAAATVSAAGGTATSITIGSAIQIVAINTTQWMIISLMGTWAIV